MTFDKKRNIYLTIRPIKSVFDNYLDHLTL